MSISEIPPRSSSEEPKTLSDLELHQVPVLLVQLQDDLARSRKREAFWISVVVHLLLVILLVASPKLFPMGKALFVATPEDLIKQKELTYLALPEDQQKLTKKPDTNIISDKDRIATSRRPIIDKKLLDELHDARRQGAPGIPRPQVPPSAPSMAQTTPGQQMNQPGAGAPAPSPNQTARLESPASPAPAAKNPFARSMSPGAAIEEAARAAASRGGSGFGGEYGLGPGGSQGKVGSNMDILSDTMGVDFGPYLSRVVFAVRNNWYNLIPEAARVPLMKKGKVSIQFAILKDGRIAGLTLVGPSGDVSLDRAAWGGITQSNPFPPLPNEFRGPYLALRFHFYYNPDKGDLQ